MPFQIFIRGPREIVITCESDKETVKSVKKKIQQKIRTPYPMQRLIHCGQWLANDKSLSHYNIGRESTLHMSYNGGYGKSILIQIDIDDYVDGIFGRFHYEDYNHSQSFKQFKQEICNKYLDESSNKFCVIYDLFVNGKRLNDNLKLWQDVDKWWGNNNNLQKIFKMKTIDGKLYHQQHKRESYDKNCILLVHGYIRKMENECNYTVPECIKTSCKNYYHRVMKTSIKIYIKLLNGKKTYTLDVEPSDGVQTLKEKMQKLEGDSPHKQRLIFDGKQLNDGMDLSDYHIKNDSTICYFAAL